MKALIAVRFASRNVGASPAEVRGLWDKYFADIPLSDTRWFEKYETRLVKKGMRIASENRKNGKTFKAVDEKHVGKYVVRIIRNLKLRKRVERIVPPFFVKAEFCFESDYRITAADQGRFAKKLFPAGECLFFGGGSASKKYPKFSANGRTGCNYAPVAKRQRLEPRIMWEYQNRRAECEPGDQENHPLNASLVFA